MELHLEDKIERRIYYTGMYEHVLDTILRRALPRSNAFVDIGANCGYVSLLAASLLMERGVVYAFEPFPSTFRRLTRNLELNPSLNIVPHFVALSNAPGTCKLHCGAGTHGATGMVPVSSGVEAVEVRCETLDHLSCELDLRGAFVKIDVEGAELLVLNGMTSVLASGCCRNILIEMHPRQIRELGGRPEEIPTLVERFGYRLLTSSGESLVPFAPGTFFASDEGHRFIFATLDADWNGFKIPSGF